ncbi:glycoside hydrolase family 18 protein [Amanita thiersii Skay4041]|uniref:chitinase n=1 Tax=Amanita thiersii Skay4041 TaxID=703135 RepID=A0A2A9NFN6_9AGAR|nr:glycoside hydrolase family 18 protein [Amanita thiersii Skay4041]
MVLLRRFSLLSFGLVAIAGVLQAVAFDNSRNDNLAVYWGQNSAGAVNAGDKTSWQKPLATYCQDDVIDVIPLSFLTVFFGAGGKPEINFSNTCSSLDGIFPGTNLANCQSMAADIKACQAKGKIITLSLGGATGNAVFSSDAQAETFAETVWNLFLGGTSSTRPLGDAVLDGIDLDIEGGSSSGYAAFVKKIRSLASGSSKKYYVTAAPQCPFPDAFLGPVLDATEFDAIYVQFYNNFCSNANQGSFNFATWDDWAKNKSPNKNVKIYIGAPASNSAAGSGYVDAATLGSLAQKVKSQYSSFGGVMLWDASQAYANGRFDVTVKNALTGGGGAPPPSSSPSAPTASGTASATTQTTGQSVTTGTSGSPPATQKPMTIKSTGSSTGAHTPGSPTSTQATESTTTTHTTGTPMVTLTETSMTTHRSANPSSTSGGGSCAGIPAWDKTAVSFDNQRERVLIAIVGAMCGTAGGGLRMMSPKDLLAFGLTWVPVYNYNAGGVRCNLSTDAGIDR